MANLKLSHSANLIMVPADPLDAVTHRNPYPYYRSLAQRQPFFRDDTLKLWIAAGASQVAEVLEHPDCRVRPLTQPVPPALTGNAAGDLFGRLIRMNDGPAHLPLKSVVLRALMHLDPAAVRLRAKHLAEGLQRIDDDDAHEANRWMFTLPVLTVAALLGLPLEFDEAGHVSTRVAGFIATFAAAMSPLATAADVEAGVAAAQWLTQWMREQPHAPDGLYARLQEANIDGATLTANAIGLMIQACEATAGLVGNTLVQLGRHGDAGDLDALVAEVARTDPPVQNTRRFLAADATLCGVPVKAGDAVLVLLAAASYDPTHAAPAKPWTFGNGRHGCPGDALARVLAACTVAGLLERGVRPLRLVQAYRYRPSLNARIPLFL